MLHYLYLKTHNKTGLKYLGQTVRDPYTYNGSGKHWKRHLDKHGTDVTTTVLLETSDKSELRSQGNYYSLLWNVVESPEFANLVPEDGTGGDTSESEAFKEGMRKYHGSKTRESYATYGMLGKTQSQKWRDAILTSNRCPVVCEGTEYESVGAAQKAYPGISIRRRLDNPRYPDFYRLRPRTLRTRTT